MNSFEGGVLGLIQGLTEFIPVSSSGHLVIGQYFLNGASDHLFLEFINIGTVLALLVFFRARIVSLVKDVVLHQNFRLARNILLSATPAGLLGLLLADFISTNPFFGSVWVVIVAMAAVGGAMVVLERLPKFAEIKDGEALSWKRALAVGVFQTFALIPGVSRSGSTIIAGRLMGLKPAAAAEFSFLLSIPIMLGVTAKLFLKEGDRLYLLQHWQILLAGNVVAFIAGIAAIGFLMRYLSRHSLAVFGWYRIALALVLAGILLLQ